VSQRPVFDPSLKHYSKAMRAGDPRFDDPRAAARWYAARRSAVDHVLAAIARSEWSRHLVLRGSVLLRAWYGEAAREPGDLDFVVAPSSWRMEDDRTERLLDEISQRAEDLSWREDGVRIDAAGAASEDIWTYDRVPGRRLVLPWTAEDVPEGTVQLDFVFGEHLPAAPEQTAIPRSDGGEPALLSAATPELSLVWKLMWLLSDMYPQGKDLYDAVLLAETTRVRYWLLRETLVAYDAYYVRHAVTAADIAALEVDWAEFRKEYPHLRGEAREYLDRLAAALAPTFAEAREPAGGEYEWHVAWLGPRIDEFRALWAREGMAAVQERLAVDASVHTPDAIVITCELLGSGRGGIDEAAQTLLSSPAWALAAGYYHRNPEKLAEELDRLRA
jgi:hypothetical protein